MQFTLNGPLHTFIPSSFFSQKEPYSLPVLLFPIALIGLSWLLWRALVGVFTAEVYFTWCVYVASWLGGMPFAAFKV